MSKENRCSCVVCNTEQALLGSLQTQTAQTHFRELASHYPILSQFDSPADVIAGLHEREGGKARNHTALNEILHALVDSMADGIAEEIGQQMLLVAYAPAIHKVYREVCRKFPGLGSEDIAQEAAVCLLETARSPEMRSLNGYLPAALARRFRQSLFRWAMKEIQGASLFEDSLGEFSEPLSTENFEDLILLEDFLAQAQRRGLLSEAEHELLLKLKYEGFGAKELADADRHRRLHRRLQTIVNRLQRELGSEKKGTLAQNRRETHMGPIQNEKDLSGAVNFSGEVCISNSEKAFSPGRSSQTARLEEKALGAVA